MLAIFLDTETTGLDPFIHDPIEIAFIIVDLASGQEVAEYERMIRITDQKWANHDPKSIEINAFTRDLLEKGQEPQTVANEIEAIYSECGITNSSAFFICQNPSFDRPFFAKIISVYRQEELGWPYHWFDLASMYWVKRADKYASKEGISFSKDSIAHDLGFQSESKPHRALNGVRHLLECYKRLFS